MVQNSFDAGIFLIMIVIGFVSVAFVKQIGTLILIVPIFAFSIIGVMILVGYDVSSYTQTEIRGDLINETSYFIGNGSEPNGTGQLWMGMTFIILSIIFGAVFVDKALKGELIAG